MPRASDAAGAAVRFDGVWKKFRRGESTDSLRDLIPALATRLVGGRPRADELDAASGDFWALHDVSFAVRPGEVLGIIGPNGAGKSTVLKLLTRILKPTRGECAVYGRTGALIEVAAGFHADLTGRENVFLQGAIMGMKRAEIARKMDEIIEFAGLGEFIDTQVKRFSSGMNARLGFSIAAHLDPEVLIIDEVLSVGDAAFQQKCLERMREFKGRGVAIVFVSHNLQQVADLCDEAIYLNRSVQARGPVPDVIAAYLGATKVRHANQTGGPIDVVRAQLTDETGATVTSIAPGTPLRLTVDYAAREAVADFHFGFVVYRSTDNLIVYDGNVQGEEIGIPAVQAGERVRLHFDFRPHLTRGQYHLECHVFHNRSQRYLGRLAPAGVFTVSEARTYAGIADIELACTPAGAGESDEDAARAARGSTHRASRARR
ncbi:MAG: ABC transporter ATP-binding protein [Gemmatimonadaceae bacterium]|nr:ABC transporter ATP-binding protein [Gemmatimonadaceae bacterium]